MRIGIRFGKELDVILLDGGLEVDGYEEFLVRRKDGDLEVVSKENQPPWRIEEIKRFIEEVRII